MKLKVTLLFFVLVFSSALVRGQTRSQREAMSIAESFLSKQGKASTISSKSDALSMVYTAKNQLRAASGKDYFYVFNRGDNNGFIIVSADIRTKEVLGYGLSGKFDYADLPPNFKAWLTTYEKEIESLDNPKSSDFLQPNPEIAPYLTKAPIRTSFPASVNPLIKTKWNQDYPYNMYCPDSDNNPTGCVATAMAQVMYYYQYPVKGTGSHSYVSKTNSYSLSANFGSTTYDWTNMRLTYDGSETSVQKQAIATLMFHCGVAADMDYDSFEKGGSAAFPSVAAAGMINYFGYDAGIEACLKDFYSDEAWIAVLKNELSSNRPVLYSGSGSKGGHAFICDGYNNDFFHFNWGWGGYADDYFQTSALVPGGYTFNDDQLMIIGIKPSSGGSATEAQLKFESISSPKDTGTPFNKSELFPVTVTTVQNVSLVTTFSGYIGLAVYDINDNFLQSIDTYTLASSPLQPGYYFPEVPYDDINISALQDGKYKIMSTYSFSMNPASRRVMETLGGESNCLYLTISGGIATISKTPSTSDPTYTITFDPQGGTVNPTTQTVVSGAAVGSLPTPTRTGYTFGGWWTDKNGSGTQYTDATVFNAADNITLYAKWTPITYTVAYNGNGNTGGTTTSSSHTYDAAKALTSNGFTRAYTVTYNYNGNGDQVTTATANYTFKEWNAVQAGGGASYTDGQSVTNLASTDGTTVNLYAQWNSESVTLPTPVWAGHTFAGWFTAATGGTLVGAGGATYTPTAAITLYAQWTTVAVVYTIGTLSNPTAGGATNGGGTYTSGASCTVSATANAGYTFINWTENGGEVSKSASYTFTVSTDRNLVANFKSNDATLKSLTVSQGTLTPVFNANTTNYTVNVTNDVSSIEIGATANNATATISGAGTKTLSVGNNTFNIVVTAEDGTTTKTYTIVVTRAQTEYTLSVSPTSLNFYANGGTHSFMIISNTSWTITGMPAWITLSANTGSGDGTVTVTANKNSDEYQRTATLTVSGSGLSSTVQLTQDGTEVIIITPTGVSLNYNTLSRNVGDPAVTLIATVTPADAYNQSVIWSTSDASVATVSEKGVVNFVGIGTATITVTTVEGNYTAVCAVNVTSASYPDEELVEEAATVILNATIIVQQTDANTQETITAWLISFFSNLLRDYNVSTSVTYTSFTSAVAGTADNPDGINGYFTITVTVYTGTAALRASKEITISGIIEAVKYVGTGIDNAKVPTLKAYASTSSLHISGLQTGEIFSIHNINGQLIYKGKAKAEKEQIAVGSNDVFVVTAGARSIKVIKN